MNKKKIFFGIGWVAILAILFVAINKMNDVVDPANQKPPPLPPNPTITNADWKQVMSRVIDSPKGYPKAPFTIVEFGDFCCPQCAAMHKQFESLPHTAPVNLYFMNRPFPTIKKHENAMFAAQAGYAAAAQHKYWPMFEMLSDHNEQLAPSNYKQYADDAGLDGTKLANDVNSGKYKAKAQDSFDYCTKLKMVITPAIIVRNNKNGEYQVASGRDQINALLAKAPWMKSTAPAAAPVAQKTPPTVAKGQ